MENNLPEHENFSSKNELELFESIDKNKVKSQIYEIRGIRVMLDRDIAAYFGVTTGNLNKAKNRNIERFPENFCFTLTDQEISLFQIGIPMQTKGIKGGREQIFYNLDMIISLGYRVKSIVATIFRRWATEQLKEYLKKGFLLDDQRLKELGGGKYWHELLNRIRDIRSSEKAIFRQVLDLYATSLDFDPESSESVAFFKMVQNKLHYAAHGHTAAEVIFERADAEKPIKTLEKKVKKIK